MNYALTTFLRFIVLTVSNRPQKEKETEQKEMAKYIDTAFPKSEESLPLSLAV